MTRSREIDLQTQNIIAGLKVLQDLLDQPVVSSALDLNGNAATAQQYDILQRMRRSLRQYVERDGDLFYVGLLGHFSAGKSSTINSLLGLHGGHQKRATGLNPTDTTITLITRTKNSSSLLGVIREGSVTIRHQAIESQFLDNLVLVDTPGTGDPKLVEEIARDFLPICDVILFLFSAASPFDKSDVPLLYELQKRLSFIPLHFVITRADELRTDSDRPLSEDNLDHDRVAKFVAEIVDRVNSLLRPHVYSAEQFTLIDNKSGFNIEKLRCFIEAKCDLADHQAGVTMHVNKLHFYQSGAKELKDFFAAFLGKKLFELKKITDAAARNIQKYQENVQISNSNLTKAWLENHLELGRIRTNSLNMLAGLESLPAECDKFPSVIRSSGECFAALRNEAQAIAPSILAALRTDVISRLRDHLYPIQKSIVDTPLSNLTVADHQIKSFTFSHGIEHGRAFSAVLLSKRSNDLCESQVSAIRDAVNSLRRAVRDLQSLIDEQAPIKACENVVASAQESLTGDLDKFFQNVELYRSGVFSHTTKESIATLGIGQQLDALELEFNEDDKSTFTTDTIMELFTGFSDLRGRIVGKLTNFSTRVRPLLDSVRSFNLARPDDNFQIVENACEDARVRFESDIAKKVQVDIDRFCGHLSNSVGNLIVKAKSELDRERGDLRKIRLRRYAIVALSGFIIYLVSSVAYHHFDFPTPKSIWGDIALNIVSGLAVEAVFLGIAKWRENIPKLLSKASERIKTSLVNDIQNYCDDSLKTFQFQSLAPFAMSAYLYKEFEYIASSGISPWSVLAKEQLISLGVHYAEYGSIREEYLKIVEESWNVCSGYFSDPSRNLEILNKVAMKIKDRAIEPSFKLLNDTQRRLDSVEEKLQAVDFS